VRGIGLADGVQRWELPLSGFLATGGAIALSETAFISSPPAAVDIATGRVHWQYVGADAGYGGPAIDRRGETLFVGMADLPANHGLIVALDAADGQVRWRADLGEESLAATERLWLDGDRLIVPLASGGLIGLDPTSGQERWRYQPVVPRLGAVTVEAGRAWLALDDGEVLALDTETGRLVARLSDLNQNLAGLGQSQRPAIVGGRVLVPIGQRLIGFALP
jgi:outer membrane protein assembly factor BamB